MSSTATCAHHPKHGLTRNLHQHVTQFLALLHLPVAEVAHGMRGHYITELCIAAFTLLSAFVVGFQAAG